MKIVIHTAMNGVGLQKDYELLSSACEGHEITLSDWLHRKMLSKLYDVAFHLEIPRGNLVRYAKHNVMIPNPEWFSVDWVAHLSKFNAVWAKTQDCHRIFSKLHKNVINSGFYSDDLRIPGMKKDRIFLHPAGKSDTKGTAQIIEAYRNNRDLPVCFVLSKNHQQEQIGNLYISNMIPFNQVKLLYNSAAVILCSSAYEGWGHYIHEGFSCGAAVMLTDYPPMNEFCQDERMLIPTAGTRGMNMTQIATLTPQDLAQSIRMVNTMTDAELAEIGAKNRVYYDRCKTDFISFVKTYLKNLQ